MLIFTYIVWRLLTMIFTLKTGYTLSYFTLFIFCHPISQATYCLLFVCHSVLSASKISPVPAPSNIVYIGWRFNIGKVNLCVSNYGCTSYKHEWRTLHSVTFNLKEKIHVLMFTHFDYLFRLRSSSPRSTALLSGTGRRTRQWGSLIILSQMVSLYSTNQTRVHSVSGKPEWRKSMVK